MKTRKRTGERGEPWGMPMDGLGDGGGAHMKRSLPISEECTDPTHQPQRGISSHKLFKQARMPYRVVGTLNVESVCVSCMFLCVLPWTWDCLLHCLALIQPPNVGWYLICTFSLEFGFRVESRPYVIVLFGDCLWGFLSHIRGSPRY